MNYVKNLNLFGVEVKEIPSITGHGVPTTATEGAVGCLYMDEDTGDLYKCVAVANGVYTWVIIGNDEIDKDALNESIENAFEEKAGDLYTLDKCGNMLPIEDAADSRTVNGVTLTHKNGVFTLNGTATAPYTFEIIPRYTEYATLKNGVVYKKALRVLSGTAVDSDGASVVGVYLMLTTTKNSLGMTQPLDAGINYTAVDENLNRFGINIPKAGVTYTDYKIAPFFGLATDYSTTYSGAIKRLSLDAAEASSAEKLKILPQMYIEEADSVIAEAQSHEADFRAVVFADPHSFDWKKYKKYAELHSRGCTDAVIGLGDFTIYTQLTREQTLKDMTQMLSHAGRTPNHFYAIGNHDIAFSTASVNSGAPNQDETLTKKELHDIMTRHLNESAHFDEENPYGGYYYVDYNASKIRFIMLNTSELYEDDGTLQYKYSQSVMIRQRQISWLTMDALDMSGKSDPSAWSVLVCCHSGLTVGTMLGQILSAVKNGSAINATFPFKRRLNVDTGVVDESNVYEISVVQDYGVQGPVDVIGVLYGHDHEYAKAAYSGINFICFIADNANLDDFHKTNVSNFASGSYYITTTSGAKLGFTVGTDVDTSKVVTIGYNNYHGKYGSNAPVRLYDADGNVIKSYNATASSYVSSMTEITGFVQERTPDTIKTESCNIVSINKDSREIIISCYGTGVNRTISY